MKDLDLPKVSFGIIVLNGEPYTRYCLRALYPFAHEIIVVEGGTSKAATLTTPDGHSTDGTLETLYRFKGEEDPDNKVQLVVRDGFWSGKDEQSRAYAARATGDYLWQVDIDEFYHPKDMQFVLEMLRDDPAITAVSFKQITFWGGLDYITDGWYLRRWAEIYHRLFQWGPGYTYVTHRPPTVHDPEGRDLRTVRWVNGHQLARRSIYLYHYSLVFPKQVLEKAEYYRHHDLGPQCVGMLDWAHKHFLRLQNPYRVHNVHTYPSWIERYTGMHPPAVLQMFEDIGDGNVSQGLRQTDDIERTLRSQRYRLGRTMLRGIAPLDAWLYQRWRDFIDTYLRIRGVLVRGLTKLRRLVSRS